VFLTNAMQKHLYSMNGFALSIWLYAGQSYISALKSYTDHFHVCKTIGLVILYVTFKQLNDYLYEKGYK